MTRTCGPCRACCICPSVEAVKKPMDTPCKYLLPVIQPTGNCSIYHGRPPECEAYKCSWLEGDLGDDEAMRPDNCGLLLESATMEGAIVNGQPYPLRVMMGFELEPGAIDRGIPQILKLLSPGKIAGFVDYARTPGLVTAGSPLDIDIFQDFMANAVKQGGINHRFADGDVFQEL